MNLFKKSKKYKLESVPDIPPLYASNQQQQPQPQSSSVGHQGNVQVRHQKPVSNSSTLPSSSVQHSSRIPEPEDPNWSEAAAAPKLPTGLESIPDIEEAAEEEEEETEAMKDMSLQESKVQFVDHTKEKSANEKEDTPPNGDEKLQNENEPPNKYIRRKSVFAEQYDPAEDDDDDAEKVVYPKTDEQRQRLSEAVQNILLFRSLDQQQMQEVLDAMFERKVQPGEIVIRQGDDGDNFYVIESGVYNIYVSTDQEKDKLVGKYENSGSFGELALMYNMPRAATIEAVTVGSLWAMNRQTFRRIVLKSAFKKRKEYENFLEKVPILQSLEPYERMNLCDALMPKSYKDGELIIKQGDEADGMYFIEAGIVRVTMINEGENGGKEVELSRLSQGQYFGELALVTHKPRAASVYAVGDVKLAFLDVQAFERLLGPCKVIMKRNIDQYEEQLAKIFGSSANISDLR